MIVRDPHCPICQRVFTNYPGLDCGAKVPAHANVRMATPTRCLGTGRAVMPGRAAPAPHGASLRAKIYARDGWRCTYCDWVFRRTPERLSLDHLIPDSRGGPPTWWNLVTACVDCNHQRSDRELGEWLLLLPTDTIDYAARVILRALGRNGNPTLRARVEEIWHVRCGP